MAKTATLKKELVFFHSLENGKSRFVPAGTEVWLEKTWKSGTVRLRVKGNLHTRQLSKQDAARLIAVGA